MTTLIEGGIVVTLGRKNEIFYPGGVVIEGETVKDVGPLEKLKIKYSTADVLDAKGKIIIPSFVNTHHHLYSTFARGMSIPGVPAENFVEIDRRSDLATANMSRISAILSVEIIASYH